MDEVLRGCYNNGTCVAPDVCECAEVSPITDSAVPGFGVVGCGGIGGVLGFFMGPCSLNIGMPKCLCVWLSLCVPASLSASLYFIPSIFCVRLDSTIPCKMKQAITVIYTTARSDR